MTEQKPFYVVDINLQVVGKIHALNQQDAESVAREEFGRLHRVTHAEGRTPEQAEQFIKESLR